MMALTRRSVVVGAALSAAAGVAGCGQDARRTGPIGPTPPLAEEPVIPLTDAKQASLTELFDGPNGLRLDIRYATANNFTGRVLYQSARAFLVGVAAQDLGKALALAGKDGFGLTIFDAYRPWSVTKQLWDATPPAKRSFVANPARGSRHNRGCSVDIGLHRLSDGQLVPMPSAYDEFSDRAYRDFPGGSAQERQNRDRLTYYVESAGFFGIANEWWHFDHRDWAKYPVLDVAFSAL